MALQQFIAISQPGNRVAAKNNWVRQDDGCAETKPERQNQEHFHGTPDCPHGEATVPFIGILEKPRPPHRLLSIPLSRSRCKWHNEFPSLSRQYRHSWAATLASGRILAHV